MKVIFHPDEIYPVSFVQRSTRDISALNVPAASCRDEFLTMLAQWASSPERIKIAEALPLHLFEVVCDDLLDGEAEIVEKRNDETIRNLYRHLFGDKANLSRTYVRVEAKPIWCLFISIFAMTHPEKSSHWADTSEKRCHELKSSICSDFHVTGHAAQSETVCFQMRSEGPQWVNSRLANDRKLFWNPQARASSDVIRRCVTQGLEKINHAHK